MSGNSSQTNSPDPKDTSVTVDKNEYNFEQEYRDIYAHINTFQVTINKPDTLTAKHNVNDTIGGRIQSGIDLLSSITVFKKKNPRHMVSGSNIYKQDTSGYELDLNDSTKSKSSCARCRKFKKKCTRTLPECSNCVSSEELCVYLSRKTKKKKLQPTSGVSSNQVPNPVSEYPDNPPQITNYFDPRNSTPSSTTTSPSPLLCLSTSNNRPVKLPSINNVLDTILPPKRHEVNPSPYLNNPFQDTVNSSPKPPPLLTTSSTPTFRLTQPATPQPSLNKTLSLPVMPVKNRKRKSHDLNNLLN